MDIGLLNEKVTFQKNTVITDSIGNHKNGWEDFYTCHATIGGEGMASSKEKEEAGTIVEDVGMTVTISWRICLNLDMPSVVAAEREPFRISFRQKRLQLSFWKRK